MSARGSGHSVVESLGVYLPPRSVSTAEVRLGCTRPITLPLERLTGIRNRRVAGDGAFSIDLAKEAVAKCLALSRHPPSEVDLLICANMSRYDGPGFRYTFEPSTSIRLRKHFNFDRALTFDVGNACAGMFTAIKVVDALLGEGLIEVGMVVSGEYITHLTRTAQLEIADRDDPRLACLTLGDAAVALTLERAPRAGVGFRAIDLYTAGAYWHYGVARPTEQEHGGAIMLTDSPRLHEVAIRHSAADIARTLEVVRWGKDALHHVILHQTSLPSGYEAARQVNALVQDTYFREDNMVNNLAERGNTASTTHWVAVWDHILGGRIRAGDNVLFGIQASGLTIGTAPYTFDDLPDRIRVAESGGERAPASPAPDRARPARGRSGARRPRVRIESLGVAGERGGAVPDGLSLVQEAVDRCLARSSYPRADLSVLIYAGVHRDGFLGEPAMGAMIADRVKLNETGPGENGRRTLAFDLFNGAVGFLQACRVGAGLIGERPQAVMVVASEVEPNAGVPGEELLGIAEVGSALILDRSPDAAVGFGSFVFRSFDEHLGAFSSWLAQAGGRTRLRFARQERIEGIYLECIPPAVDELLRQEGLRIEDVSVVLPPQMSATFVPRLRDALGGSRARFVDLAGDGGDLYSSTLVHTLRQAEEQGWVRKGDLGLIINVGSGIQVGCATYYF